METPRSMPLLRALAHVAEERDRQDAKWGEQNPPDGTGSPDQQFMAEVERLVTEEAFRSGHGTWMHILREEVCEALGESDPVRLREELVQVAAVAVAWVEAIDRRAD